MATSRLIIVGILLAFTLILGGCATYMNDTCPGPTEGTYFVVGAKDEGGIQNKIWMIRDGRIVPIKVVIK